MFCFKLWLEMHSLNVLDDEGKEYKCDNCGRCCIGVSINSTLPDGEKFTKAAGERCVHLSLDNLCKVWGNTEEQPEVCRSIKPNNSLCRFDLRGDDQEAKKHFKYLSSLERATKPK